jgi:hypothetical protein
MLNIINAEWDIMSNGKNVDWIHRQNVDVKVPPVKKFNEQKIERDKRSTGICMYVVCISMWSLLVVKIKNCLKIQTHILKNLKNIQILL